jgi:catechol 2,3-dioxygenase-like lactoylglutathione lyase family enzyme
VSPFPDDLFGWTSTLHHVPDVAAEVAFYRDAMGFPVVGQDGDRTILDISFVTGANSILEIAPGGKAQQLPTTREERTDAVIMRANDHTALNAALKARGVPMVNDAIQFNSAELTYVGTPSGAIIGFEERYDPKDFKTPRHEFLEDKEANRRWLAHLATKN